MVSRRQNAGKNFGTCYMPCTVCLLGVLMAICSSSAFAQTQLVIGAVGDYGFCTPNGNTGIGNVNARCSSSEQPVADMIHSWNPDYILLLGDDTNSRGNRADTWKSVYVKLATAVTCTVPCSQQVAIDTNPGGNFNNSLYLDGTDAQLTVSGYSSGPYLLAAGTPLGVGEGTVNWEQITVTSVQDSTHFTAAWSKQHPVGEVVHGSDSTPYLNDIASQKAWGILGNHDYQDPPTYDWCASYTGTNRPCSSSQYYSDHSVALEYWTNWWNNNQGRSHYSKVVDPTLLTIFAADSFSYNGYGLDAASVQGQYFHNASTGKMEACSTRWCISLAHYPEYEGNANCGPEPDALNLRGWLGGPKVDAVFSGHCHNYERMTVPNYDGSKTIPLWVVGTGGDGLDGSTTQACGTGCTLYANQGLKYGAAKVTVTSTSFKVDYYTVDNPSTPFDTFTLTKAVTGPGASPSPTSLAFGTRQIGTSSSPQAVILSNNGNATLNITSIALTGANASEFSITNNCGTTLGAGLNCTINVTFSPATTGSKAASLTITDNAATSPQNVPLAGTGSSTSLSCKPSELVSPQTFTNVDPNLDKYGGDTRYPCSGGAKGSWYTDKDGNKRWWLCTPAGNRFYANLVWNATYNSTYDIPRYGDVAHWAPQLNRRLMTWGYNGYIGGNSCDQFGNSALLPWAANAAYSGDGSLPVKMPTIQIANANVYAFCDGAACGCYSGTGQINGGYKVKDLHHAAPRWMDYFTYSPIPDLADDKYYNWMQGAVAKHKPPAYSDYFVGWIDGDDDYNHIFGAGREWTGPSFSTVGNGSPDNWNRGQIHGGLLALATSPIQTAWHETQPHTNDFAYPDTQVKTKAHLKAWLQAKYGTIAALNAAWGSNYTQWNSTGTTRTAILSGSGTGPYTATLTAPISRFSLQILANGVAVGGDGTHVAYAVTTVYGPTVNSASSSFSLSTGAISVVFTSTPAAPVTVSYVTGGFGSGTGWDDEDGTCPTKVSACWCPTSTARGWMDLTPSTGEAVTTAMKQDLDDWLTTLAAKYWQKMRTAIDAGDPVSGGHRLYFSNAYVGSWGAPPHSSILKGVQNNSPDVMMYYDLLPRCINCGDTQNVVDFLRSSMGVDMPWMQWTAVTTTADSAVPNTGADTIREKASTQNGRGLIYKNTVQGEQGIQDTNGVYHFIGQGWWELFDNSGEGQGWGILSYPHANVYDGSAAVIAPGTDQWGCSTGGEAGSYGDFLTSAKAANTLWKSLPYAPAGSGGMKSERIGPSRVTGTLSTR